jgi:hypothetical protein
MLSIQCGRQGGGHSNLAESQNAVWLNGAGHDGDSPDATSSDASTHNFWTMMLAGRWSALAGGDGAGWASSTSKPQQTTAARGRFPYERCRPAIVYSRVSTGRTPSPVPSSSNFPASHLGSELGLIAQSCRAFFISATVADLHEHRNDIVSQQSGPCAVVVYRARLRNCDKFETVR